VNAEPPAVPAAGRGSAFPGGAAPLPREPARCPENPPVGDECQAGRLAAGIKLEADRLGCAAVAFAEHNRHEPTAKAGGLVPGATAMPPPRRAAA
jgi:hypothetical protein